MIIFSLRPSFRDASKKTEEPIAKTTFTKSTGKWKIYGMRADMKWHRYEPVPDVEMLDDFLAVIDDDEFGCFWG